MGDWTRRGVLGAALAGVAAPRLLAQDRDAPAVVRYNRESGGTSLLVMRAGEVLIEDYPNGGAPDRANWLASGTKSFNGVIAAAAAADNLLTIDEPAALTLPEWRSDPLRSRVTLRHILSLTSGLQTRATFGDTMTYAEAVALPAAVEPGTRFAYGGDPFQLFGAIMHRKLRERETPVDYLRRRVLEPAGVALGGWRNGRDGLPQMAGGARLTARDWARYGELVRNGCRLNGRDLVDPATLRANFEGAPANPAYGLSWWLNREVPAALRRSIPQLTFATDLRPDPAVPADLVFAAGAGRQRLFISREAQLVVVRQAPVLGGLHGGGRLWSDLQFWRLLADGARWSRD